MFEIFHYDFMQRALVAGLMIGLTAPTIGMFLVVRRYSLMADTLAHVSLAGVAIGMLLGVNPFVTALVTTVVAALGIERLRQSRKIFGESVLAIFLSGSLALSTVLLSIAKGLNAGVLSLLFGSITTVTRADVIGITALGIVVIVTVLALYKELFALSFDEEISQSAGMPVKALNTLIVVLAAFTVAIAIRVVGVLLIGALMVIPVIAALQWRKSFRSSLLLSVVFSESSVIAGLCISYIADIATGGSIVAIALAIFLFSYWMNRR